MLYLREVQFDIHASVKHPHNDNRVVLVLVKDDVLLMRMLIHSGRNVIANRSSARVTREKLEGCVQAFEASPTLRNAPSLLCVRGYLFQIQTHRPSDE